MGPRLALPLVALALATAVGCGDEGKTLSLLCLEGEAPIRRALEAAPGSVRLADGTPLSLCVARARADADLQSFGVIATRVADRLADQRDGTAALQLGYLIGAARRGGAKTQGVHAELLHRLEVTGRRVDAARRAELERGMRAGEAGG